MYQEKEFYLEVTTYLKYIKVRNIWCINIISQNYWDVVLYVSSVLFIMVTFCNGHNFFAQRLPCYYSYEILPSKIWKAFRFLFAYFLVALIGAASSEMLF